MGAWIAVYIPPVVIDAVSLIDLCCRCHRSFLAIAILVAAFIVVFALLVSSVNISA